MARLPALHICHGPDEYRRQARVRELLASWQNPDEQAFDLTRLSARDGAERILTAIATPPLFAPRRVVVVEDADAADRELGTAIVAEVRRVDPTGHALRVLLIYGNGKKPDKTISAEAGSVEDFASLRYERDGEAWARQYARDRYGIQVTANAAQALIRAVGHENTGSIAQEIDKIVRMTGGSLAEADIAEATDRLAAQSPYELYDAIGDRRSAAARLALRRLLELPDWPGVRVLIGIASHVSKLAHARAILDAGQSPGAVDGSFKGFAGEKAVRQARKWTLAELDRALTDLAQADLELKSGGDEHRTLDLFILRATALRT